MSYFQALTDAMTMLARHPRTVFIGQSVKYGGQRAHATFAGVPEDRRIEMPICEDFTVGFATGLALEGYLPVVFIPRWDFLLLAANQIVNHLDKIPLLGDFRPKVLIRTAVGANSPLDPGPQHTQDYSEQFAGMCKTMKVHIALDAEHVDIAYLSAMQHEHSAIVVEHMELY